MVGTRGYGRGRPDIGDVSAPGPGSTARLVAAKGVFLAPTACSAQELELTCQIVTRSTMVLAAVMMPAESMP
jgi:hypothetical protein